MTNSTLKGFFIVMDHFVAHEIASHIKFLVAYIADVIVALSVGFTVVPHAVSVQKCVVTNAACEKSATILWLPFICMRFHVVRKCRL